MEFNYEHPRSKEELIKKLDNTIEKFFNVQFCSSSKDENALTYNERKEYGLTQKQIEVIDIVANTGANYCELSKQLNVTRSAIKDRFVNARITAEVPNNYTLIRWAIINKIIFYHD